MHHPSRSSPLWWILFELFEFNRLSSRFWWIRTKFKLIAHPCRSSARRLQVPTFNVPQFYIDEAQNYAPEVKLIFKIRADNNEVNTFSASWRPGIMRLGKFMLEKFRWTKMVNSALLCDIYIDEIQDHRMDSLSCAKSMSMRSKTIEWIRFSAKSMLMRSKTILWFFRFIDLPIEIRNELCTTWSACKIENLEVGENFSYDG